jgi:hypothetical protein
MKKIFICALICLVLGVQGGEAGAATKQVWLMAGQSNRIGQKNTTYQPRTADSYIQLYIELAQRSRRTEVDMTVNEIPVGNRPAAPRYNQIVPRNPLKLAPVLFAGNVRSGSEIQFGRLLYGKYPSSAALGNIVIAKFAVGGSSLEDNWIHPDHGVAFVDRAIDFLQELTTKFHANGDGFILAGVIWDQGETDTRPLNANVYRENLDLLFSKIKQFAHRPRLPVVIVRTHMAKFFFNGDRERIASYNKVRAAQQDYVRDNLCTYLVNKDDLTHDPVGVHFLSSQHTIMGTREFNAVMHILNRVECR